MKHLIFVLPVITWTLLPSCKDIIAENISGRTPELVVPFSGDTIMQNPVQFKWNQMNGATSYHLEVVSPSFSAISEFVLDTIIHGTSIDFPLDTNVYELKLTALNAGYTSQTLGPITFYVGISPSSAITTINLFAPADVAYVQGSFNGPFSWSGGSDVVSYEYSLRKGSSFATGSIIYTQNALATTNFSLPATVSLSEGTYYWGVKGYLSSGETYYSTRSLKVDVTSPGTPSLVSPAQMSMLSVGNIQFSWIPGSNGGVIQSPIHSLIEVASDSGFSTLVFSDSLTSATTTHNLTAGSYYWRVAAKDEAGNFSSYSTTGTFTVN